MITELESSLIDTVFYTYNSSRELSNSITSIELYISIRELHKIKYKAV